jgi:hypothetical protein
MPETCPLFRKSSFFTTKQFFWKENFFPHVTAINFLFQRKPISSSLFSTACHFIFICFRYNETHRTVRSPERNLKIVKENMKKISLTLQFLLFVTMKWNARNMSSVQQILVLHDKIFLFRRKLFSSRCCDQFSLSMKIDLKIILV